MKEKVAVLVTAFNRADLVAGVMRTVQEYRPEKLYLACDGARAGKAGEQEAVEETQRVMLEAVNWTCDVKTLFRKENLGCAQAMSEAISWMLEQEEWGIILEDDIEVSQDFFHLCEELLPRYRNEERIMEISARNESRRRDIQTSYLYSQCFHCWGWATWRRAWQRMDMEMKAIERRPWNYFVKRLGWFRGLMMYWYFKQGKAHLATFSSWATRWYLSILDHDGLVICPKVNLALNHGMECGTHYKKGDIDPYAGLTIGRLEWPLTYNDQIATDAKQKKADSQVFRRVRWCGLRKKLKF